MIRNLDSYRWSAQKLIHRAFVLPLIRRLIPRTVSLRERFKLSDSKIIALAELRHDVPFTSQKIFKQSSKSKGILFSLSDCVVNPSTGVVWTTEGLVKESSCWPASSLAGFEPRPSRHSLTSFEGQYTLLPDNGFYHFLVEDLPRFLDCISQSQEITTICHKGSGAYVYDVLKGFDFEFLESAVPIKVEKLLLSEKPMGGFISPTDIVALRKFFLPKLDDLNRELAFPSRERIFIKRNLAASAVDQISSRALDYQESIENLLVGQGVETIFLESLRFQDQIKKVSKCKTLIGHHGAGLSLMVFMPQGSKIIEISGTRHTYHFANLAKACGHRYERVEVASHEQIKNITDFLD